LYVSSFSFLKMLQLYALAVAKVMRPLYCSKYIHAKYCFFPLFGKKRQPSLAHGSCLLDIVTTHTLFLFRTGPVCSDY
jgi:hypothetical protein